MSHDLGLIIALAAPFLLFVVLRINAAMVFLSLCLGYVLVDLVAKDSNSLIKFLTPHTGSLSETTWNLVILLTPVVLTCVMMIFSVKERWKVLLNILPAAATSVLLASLAVPLLTPGLRHAMQSQALWQQINRAQSFIIVLGACISLIMLWAQRKTMRGEKK
ncbi:MAG TPA: hypothetical protein VF733_03475 [Candidatus Saccharimonadales bacterium]